VRKREREREKEREMERERQKEREGERERPSHDLLVPCFFSRKVCEREGVGVGENITNSSQRN